jgi:hypothetical protein
MIQSLIISEKLEEILLKNWTHFIDRNRLIAFVLEKVRDGAARFPISHEAAPTKSARFSISRFQPQSDGFVIWIEVVVPTPMGFVVGTTEIFHQLSGGFTHTQTIGSLHPLR